MASLIWLKATVVRLIIASTPFSAPLHCSRGLRLTISCDQMEVLRVPARLQALIAAGFIDVDVNGVELLDRGQRLIVLLTADVLRAEQRKVALNRDVCYGGGRHGFSLVPFRATVGCLIGRRSNLIERLARLYGAPLSKAALQNDPADLRTNLRDAKCRHAARRLRGDG